MAPAGSPLVRGACAWTLCAAVVLAPACSEVRVRRTDDPDLLLEAWQASAITRCGLSPRTVQTLRRWDLDHVYLRDPAEAAARLHAEAVKDPQPELLFALAEVHYLRGRDAEKRSSADAIAAYYLCAGYAYHYLFDEYRPPLAAEDRGSKEGDGVTTASLRSRWRRFRRSGDEVFDPRFRLACDLYNAGLAKCIAAAQRAGHLDPRQQLSVPTGDGTTFTLSVVHAGFNGRLGELGPLLLCEDFEVSGLANQYHGYGLGVPLIATSAAVPTRAGPAEYPHGISLPVTAFFRFEGSLADLGACRAGRLELYNPLAVEAVAVRGRTVPLETDLTTPLAYYLAHSQRATDGVLGFVRADRLRTQSGIHMLAPYQPGKIPVVLVHGLLSSPLTWAPVFNDLQADPVLRARFQFWYYFYPTGNPYLVTAANLRQDLAGLRRDIDPQHRDRALDQMVFVGHSMGGLVSRLLTVDSGEDFWRLVSDRPLDDVRLQPGSRADLREVFFFQPVPGVRRVVFIGTPHHGSRLSPSPLGRLADKLVRLPGALLSAVQDLSAENPDLASAIRLRQIPTSVDLLAPGARALEVLAGRPRPAGVHYHTIAGVVRSTTVKLENFLAGDSEPGDGVVPYRSAHLEEAESELVVPADHFNVHHHPLSILEIRRILLEHYREAAGQLGDPPAAPPPPAPVPLGAATSWGHNGAQMT